MAERIRKKYAGSLKAAQADLLNLYKQRETLDREIARTRQYVQTLLMMAQPEAPDPGGATYYNTIGNNLTEIVRVILSGSSRPLSVPTIRDQIFTFGFEIKSSNPLASIHSVLGRLIEQGEVHVVCKIHPDGEIAVFTRSFWWGEYGKLPKGWVLETEQARSDASRKAVARVYEGRAKEREKALEELKKRSAETRRDKK